MPRKKAGNDCRARLEAWLKANKMRLTQERFAVLDKVMTMRAHFDVESVHDALEQEGYHISLTTAYNTMELLVRAGILRRLQFDSRQSVYELASSNHIHLVCTVCGKIMEDNDAELAEALISHRFRRFTPQWLSATLFGVCSTCRRAQKKSASGKNTSKNNKTL